MPYKTMPRSTKTRLWADQRSWVVQEKNAKGEWTSVRWYQKLESMAAQEMEARAKARVARGQEIMTAVTRATAEVIDALADLRLAIHERTVDIPGIELSRLAAERAQ